jgi:hypothetical protein
MVWTGIFVLSYLVLIKYILKIFNEFKLQIFSEITGEKQFLFGQIFILCYNSLKIIKPKKI